jgi:hypothetical protein
MSRKVKIGIIMVMTGGVYIANNMVVNRWFYSHYYGHDQRGVCRHYYGHGQRAL